MPLVDSANIEAKRRNADNATQRMVKMDIDLNKLESARDLGDVLELICGAFAGKPLSPLEMRVQHLQNAAELKRLFPPTLKGTERARRTPSMDDLPKWARRVFRRIGYFKSSKGEGYEYTLAFPLGKWARHFEEVGADLRDKGYSVDTVKWWRTLTIEQTYWSDLKADLSASLNMVRSKYNINYRPKPRKRKRLI